jgi:hypothetical protein
MAFIERSSRPKNISMEIVADGMQANENPAAWHRGLGCITGNNSSRLLLFPLCLFLTQYELLHYYIYGTTCKQYILY